MSTKREEDLKFLVDFLLASHDIFMTGYIGYWGHGVRVQRRVWVVIEDEDLTREARNKLADEVLAAWAAGTRKFENDRVHVLDEAAARKVAEEGCKRYGENFLDDHDATMLDVAIQRALLGEVRYG